MSLPRLLAVPAVLLLAATLAGCGEDAEEATTGAPSGVETTQCDYTQSSFPAAKDVEPPPEEAQAEGEIEVTLATGVGDLVLTLDAEKAPCTTNSFVSLAEQGFFDGTSCHRLTTRGIFVLQCGDPTGQGTGGPGYSFDDELSGEETYPAGTLAMANSGPDTNGSQFFIVYDDTPLPPAYTVFGTVDEASLETVRDVAADGTDEANAPGDGMPKTAVTIDGATVER